MSTSFTPSLLHYTEQVNCLLPTFTTLRSLLGPQDLSSRTLWKSTRETEVRTTLPLLQEVPSTSVSLYKSILQKQCQSERLRVFLPFFYSYFKGFQTDCQTQVHSMIPWGFTVLEVLIVLRDYYRKYYRVLVSPEILFYLLC